MATNSTTSGDKLAEPLVVYDGLRLIGSIQSLPGKRALARNADGKQLGEFSDQSEATHALKAHAGRRGASS